MESNKPFTYEVDHEFGDHTIDEKGNTYIALRKIRWGNSNDYKLDLRKYYATDQGEQMSKGVSFLTDEGPNELTKVLLETGYGNAEEIAETISDKRPDIMELLVNNEDNDDDEDLMDPEELFDNDEY